MMKSCWCSHYKVKEVHWQSVLTKLYTYYLSYIHRNCCSEIMYISRVMLIARGSHNNGTLCRFACETSIEKLGCQRELTMSSPLMHYITQVNMSFLQPKQQCRNFTIKMCQVCPGNCIFTTNYSWNQCRADTTTMLLTLMILRRIYEVPGGGSATWGVQATSELLSSTLEGQHQQTMTTPQYTQLSFSKVVIYSYKILSALST